MAGARLRPCPHPGCRELVESGRCTKHARQRDQERGNARERGYTAAWDKASRAFLRANPICADPYKLHPGPVMAECTDHIVPHRRDQRTFWDPSNWQPLCNACHGVKTGKGE